MRKASRKSRAKERSLRSKSSEAATNKEPLINIFHEYLESRRRIFEHAMSGRLLKTLSRDPGERRDPNSIYTRVCIYEIVKVLRAGEESLARFELTRCKHNTTSTLRGQPWIIPRASIIKIPRGKKEARSLARANNKLVIQTYLIARHGSRSVLRWDEQRERER